MSRRLRQTLPGPLFFLCLCLLWELIARAGLVSRLYFPPLSTIIQVWFKLVLDGTLPLAVGETFWRMGAGYLLAAAVMIPLGVLLGRSPRLEALAKPCLELARPLPPPVIIPAVMLFLGIGDAMKIFVVFFACVFPILQNAMDGAKSAPRLLLDSARMLGAGRASLLWRVVLPSAWPGVMAGLRTALPMALIVAVLSEMIGSVDGVGHYILSMQRLFNIPEMYAGVVCLGIVGWLLNAGFAAMERRGLSSRGGWKKGDG